MTNQAQTEEAIFLAAMELAAAESRMAYVQLACAGDENLRRRLVELLASHDASRGPLDMPPPGVKNAVTIDQPLGEGLGTQIGPYKLLQQIGEGGMGVVYMAEQTEPVKRRVALKIIKPGMDSRQVIARFEAERQALSLMDHPNIARVFDAGTTGSGRPYFVMELVKGQPITEYCDEHHLTPRQRLELLLPVCHAIQHAHQKGIIHRDIKPTNILVAEYDNQPVPKVIDFGVAKAISQTLTEKTMFTGLGQIVGTLEYMSPEQAKVNQLDIDTRSDIYSLGVLMYELLTGSTPLDKVRLRSAGWDEMLRIIREEEPPKPSTKLSSSETLPSVAANRSMEPARLSRTVRGELDWIVMKALEKDRNRRYETANGFAADVQRYLADEPVQACPPSAWYRLRKFARRNKGPVLAVSLVLLALTAGIVGTTWQAIRAANRAEGERRAKERAEADFALANEAVEKYLGTVTDDPDLKRVDLNQLRKKLLEGAIPFFRRIAERKSDDPDVEARRGAAYLRLASLHLLLGENEPVIQDAEAARAVFARLNADSPAAPRYRLGLAHSHGYLGRAWERLGNRTEPEAASRRAVDLLDKLVGEFQNEPLYRHELTANLKDLASFLRLRGERVEAEASLRRAKDILQILADESQDQPVYRRDLAQAHNNLGNMLSDPKEAETVLLLARDIQQKLVDEFPDDAGHRLDLAKHHHNLGLVYNRLGQPEKAVAAQRESLKLLEKLADEFRSVPEYREGVGRSREQLAQSYHNLGEVLSDPGKRSTAYSQAANSFEELVSKFPTERRYRSALAESHNCRGTMLLTLGEREEAHAAFRRALELREELVDQVPHETEYAVHLGGSYCNLGNLIRNSGEPEAALVWYGKAIERLGPVSAGEKRLVKAREFLRNTHWGRAQAFDALDRHAEAARDGERALELDDGREKDVFRSGLAFSRMLGFQKDKDSARFLVAAAEYEALKRTDAGGLYAAACIRAACAAVIQEDPKTPAADAARLAKEQADLAMTWLHKAVAAGYRNAAHMNANKDLDTLREREDFNELLAELENKKK